MPDTPTVHTLDVRLSTHEAVCAERQGSILRRLGRLEKIMLGTAGVLIIGMVKALFELVAVADKMRALAGQ
jgi:hypothetical protein